MSHLARRALTLTVTAFARAGTVSFSGQVSLSTTSLEAEVEDAETSTKGSVDRCWSGSRSTCPSTPDGASS